MENTIESFWDDNPIDVSTEVNFIWQVATLLHGVSYKDADHRDVILPMTVLRRLECALAPTKDDVVAYAREHPDTPEAMLCKKSKQTFFNRSPWTLEGLLSVDDQANDLKDYINGFSHNVAEIFKELKFFDQIDEMEKKDVLNGVIKSFAEIDLSPDTIDSVKMGYIFEDLMRKFYESAEAGKQYTGRDIVRLMVSILMREGAEDVFKPGQVVTVLDQACGTGGMLSTTFSYITHVNPKAQMFLYGQEYDEAAHAICIAEMLIKGQNPENVRLADSLREDCFPNRKMRFVIENPPFGTAWGGEKLEKREKDVKAQFGEGKRYPAGLPGKSDSQMLFVQSAVDKMMDGVGRAAIIEHAGPMYTGDAGSGESEIRRWLLKEDLIEAIIALPTDLFYNTGLQTFIWVLSKNKAKHRRGKVQLIDASSFCHPLRKKLGEKKNEITPEDREAITALYSAFAEGEHVKIFEAEDFLYREYCVIPPMQRRYEISAEKVEELAASNVLSKMRLKKGVEGEILEALRAQIGQGSVSSSREPFVMLLEEIFKQWEIEIKDAHIEKIAHALSSPDPKAEIERNKKGEIIYDEELKDIEIVPFKENIEDYMAREVLPHLPGAKAFFLENLTKKKPVIKTGAEFPFTRYFYKYEEPEESGKILKELAALDKEIAADFAALMEGAK